MFLVLPQALMEAHDCIAEQELDVEIIEDVDQDEKTTKLVSLEKTRDMPLVKFRVMHLYPILMLNVIFKFYIQTVSVILYMFRV